MKTPKLIGAALLALALVPADVTAQVEVRTIQGVPGADMPMLPGMGRQMKSGKGRISGRVITADSGGPVRRAQVRLSGSEVMAKSAITDNEGRYDFRDLPAGKYTISVTKSGYVNVQYGQTRPFEQGKSIELVETQPMDKADITMPRGSVISGRLVDEFGEPMPDAAVTAMRSTWVNGKRRLQPAGRPATSNDLGQYRIYGLPPGEYYISATLRGAAEMMVTEMAMAASFTVSTGGPQSSGSEPRSGYAPTYYPGTPNGAEAQRIPLAAGEEKGNADFGLMPVKLAKVTGTVIGSDGRPVEGAMINAAPRNASEIAFPNPLGAARTDRNGNFTMPSVAPGDYTLRASGLRMVTSAAEGGEMVFMTRINMGGGDGQTEFGSVPLSVSGEDVTNVMIMTSKGTTATGHVTWEGGSKPANSATVRIAAMSTENDGPLALAGGSAPVSAEGSFEIKGIAGQRLFRPTGLPAGWVLKSVKMNGQDITDTGLDVKSNEPITGLDVVLTSKTTEVTGSVKAGNDPATDYTVVIFAEDSQKWTVPMTRYISGTRPNQDGRFQVKNLPAGSYYAVALDYIPQGDWNDPDVLERLREKATRFTLDEGKVETLDLKLSGS
jgi:protocatechuate 3,4-dioxygenase beta subunit